LSQIEAKTEKLKTGITEFDRVLGEGITAGSLTLLSGEPGIGKSTIVLELASKLADQGKKILYISGEESAEQISNRAGRLCIKSENVEITSENALENILHIIDSQNPDFIIVDSIQVIASMELPSIAGSINQVRYCSEEIMRVIKAKNIATFLIGHVTKDGTLAGPKMLEHLVDTVLLIEGERYQNMRILRSLKNRFGSTNEIGLFEMTENGLKQVLNASEFFLDGRKQNAVGSVITATIEGTRPLLLEVQALTHPSAFGYPKRTASGYDSNRLQLLLAVIQKHLNLNVNAHDVYINVIGGFKLRDHAADLAIILAIISSLKKMPLPSNIAAFGEVGLSGEIRKIAQHDKRVKESQKMGFSQLVTPDQYSDLNRLMELF
ncbi:DNA repair protein RadA, partial [Candidatus Peregrinibacteria bacterium]|nr:DNA repair protein RadA [Candidatus Peregrinibacteria bacterium]